ncbi:MAG TPA: NEW3 domain-containing protein, partial [Blastocatellia bacterium]|nr:NEW3 domain-containing protein [Blastocatellia bacterium]
MFEGLDVSITGIAYFAGEGTNAKALLKPLVQLKEIAAQALAEFQPETPERIAPKLAEGLHQIRALRQQIGSLDPEPRATVDAMLARKEREFSDALVKAHGIIVDALSNTEIVTPGEKVEVRTNLYFGSNSKPKELNEKETVKLSAPANWKVDQFVVEPEAPAPPSPFFRGRERADFVALFQATVPQDETPSQPYWLVKQRTRDQFDWDASMPLNLPFAPPILSAQVKLTLNGENVTINQPVEYRFSDKSIGEIRRDLKVAPALTLTMHPSLLVIPQNTVAKSTTRAREVSVEITHNARHATNGTLKLVTPAGWKVEGDGQALAFTRQGEKISRRFLVTPAANASGTFTLKAVATADGRDYASGYQTIEYPHTEKHFLYHPAET